MNYFVGKQVIRNISLVIRRDGKLFIGGIPDKTKRSQFYDTFEKKLGFLKTRVWRALRKIDGEDRLGWWWRPDQMRQICSELGLECKILEESDASPTRHYRFDALITNTK